MADRCRDLSLAHVEPLDATASRVFRWLLVEVPGAWAARDWVDCVPGHVAGRLREFARRHRCRVVLIRRSPGDGPVPSGVEEARQLFWAESDALPDGVLRRVTGSLDELVHRDAPPPSSWPIEHAPLWLVCVHSAHDVCCGIYGRALLRAIGDDERSRVWECSHIGGDRFAANVVELPTGVYYGRVGPENWPRLLASHASGAIDLEHYRGRSAFGRVGQAAEIAVRTRFGLAQRADVTVVSAAKESGLPTDRPSYAVDVNVRGRQVRVRLVQGDTEPRRLTCKSVADETPPHLVVRSITAHS